jgi:hypothetical protein
MLTGELPLGRFEAPSRKVQIDVRLDEVVLRTLEKEPGRRYQHASDIKTEVETISGYGARPFVHPRMHGYEYRSPRQLFGWPLVHIATGIDPRTGRKRVAKGIVAIGDCAVGGLLAIGGAAIGPIAIGGAAIGLFSIGGASVGLLGALGGAAVGIGLSLGGGAIGTIAVGGLALGIYSYGGAAIGMYPYGAAHQNPGAMEIWFDFAGPLPVGVWIVLGFLTPLFLTLFSLLCASVIAKPRDQQPRPEPETPRKFDPYHQAHHRSSACSIGCLVAFLLLVPLMAFCLLCVVGLFLGLSSGVPEAVREAEQVATVSAELAQAADSPWQMTELGPAITDRFAEDLRLDSEQQKQFDNVLQETFQEYLQVEKDHISQTTWAAGRVSVTIEAFPKETEVFENRLWSRLDALLNVEQQQIAREQLPVHAPDASVDIISPTRQAIHVPRGVQQSGILGWGRTGCHLEIWRTGSWYQWQLVRDGVTRMYRAPELPLEYRRFWPEDLSRE